MLSKVSGPLCKLCLGDLSSHFICCILQQLLQIAHHQLTSSSHCIHASFNLFISSLCCRHNCRLFWSHLPSDELAGNKYIAIQRMAQAAGLAQLEENSHLCVHPKFGPWIALRCALVFDNVPYAEPQAVPHIKPLSVSTQQYIQMAMRSALRKPSINLEDAGQDKPRFLHRAFT